MPTAISVWVAIGPTTFLYQNADAGVWGGVGPEPTVWTGTFTEFGHVDDEPNFVRYDGSGGFNASPDNTPCDPFTLPLPYP